MADEIEDLDPSGEEEGEEDLEATIRRIVGEELTKHRPQPKKIDVSRETSRPRTRRDEETDIAALVRAEVAAIKDKESHDAEHQRLKTAAEAKEAKRKPPVPAKPNRFRSTLWGAEVES